VIDRTELTQEQKDEIIAQALTFDGMGRMYPPEFCPPPPIIPYSAREDCSSCCDKKSCCEPSDSKTQIPINDAEMYWDLHPVEVTDIPDGREPVGNDKVVAIEWGWSAGMTDDELTQIAEDAPSWKYSVKTTLPMAEEFYNRLGELIKKMKG
jgi:hypothetical protein